MKNKRCILSALLCILLTVNLVITDVVAYACGNNMSYTNQQVDNINENVATDLGEIDIEANNSLGALFESELSDVTSEQEATDGYNVFSVEMVDTVAVVDFETLADCKLVVGIYDEANDQLLMSGSLDVYAGETQAYVDIDTDAMPDYYYIRAYLVAYDTLQPLSNEYESSMYTKEMQEFLAKTTDDFNQELVLNFDDDKTNNFAVYAENTKRIEKTSDDVNQVTSIDEDNNTYVIENADDEILSLVAGDVFAYEYTDDESDVLIVKVKSSGLSASCTITVKAKTTDEEKPETPKYYPTINTSYRTHIQSFGWEGDASDIKTWKSNGTMSGTSGKAKRLEGINIVVNSAEAGKNVDLGIQYTTHCQSYGWLPWSADGEMNGTEGEAKRLEAIKIQLTGADKDAYDVCIILNK